MLRRKEKPQDPSPSSSGCQMDPPGAGRQPGPGKVYRAEPAGAPGVGGDVGRDRSVPRAGYRPPSRLQTPAPALRSHARWAAAQPRRPGQPRPGPEWRRRGPSQPGFVPGGGGPVPAPAAAPRSPGSRGGGQLRSAPRRARRHRRVASGAPRGPGGSGRPAPSRPGPAPRARRGHGPGGSGAPRASPLRTKRSARASPEVRCSQPHPRCTPAPAALPQSGSASGTSRRASAPGACRHPHTQQPRTDPIGSCHEPTPHPDTSLEDGSDPGGGHWEPESSECSLIFTHQLSRQRHGEVRLEGMLWKGEKFAVTEGQDLTSLCKNCRQHLRKISNLCWYGRLGFIKREQDEILFAVVSELCFRAGWKRSSLHLPWYLFCGV